MSEQAGRRPTLAAVAREAGVSLATVSKVVNGRDDVAADTRERVRRLLVAHDYVPISARRAGGEPLISVVFNQLDSPWAVEIMRGIESAGVAMIVTSISHYTDADRWAEHVVRHSRSGAIMATAELTASQRQVFAKAGLPVVIIDPIDLPHPDVPSVGSTNWAGGLSATRHLVELGHRRIGVIGGTPRFLCTQARIDGYKAALAQAGLPFEERLLRYGDFHNEGGFKAACELLDQPDRPTAIFAGSDEQALGVIEAARVNGLTVPGDLSIVGFDDLPVARWSSPPLTTVRQPLWEMGRLAGRMMLKLVQRQPLDSDRVELATELVVRSSTAPPPA